MGQFRGGVGSDLYERALDQAAELVIITDADLAQPGGPKIVYVNQALEHATGYSRRELVGKSPRILQGPGTDREVASRIKERLALGKRVQETILNYKKNGTPYWTQLNISSVYGNGDERIAFLSLQYDLSELHKAREISELEFRLRSTGEKIASVGSWSYDLAENKVSWSAGIYEIFEWDEDQAPPSITDCQKLVYEADRPLVMAMHEACIQTRTPYQTDFRGLTLNGKAKQLRLLGEAMLGDDGRVVGAVGAIRDITEEKNLKAELEASRSRNEETEQYFSIARNIAKIGVFDYWINYDRLHWSSELIEMTGLPADLFPASAEVFLSRIDPRYRSEYARLMEAATDRREGYSITLRFNRPDGRNMYMAIVAEVRESEFGPRVVGVARDVTQDVETAQRLRREQERFRIIADSVSDVLWDYDFELNNFWITPNWPSKLGMDFEISGSDPREWLCHVSPDDQTRVVESISEAFQSRRERWDCEFRIQDSRGNAAEVEIKSSIIWDNDGCAHRVLGNCRNVTIEKRQREGFTRSRALEAVGQMTGGIAHDFNNLLMIIQGNAELISLSAAASEDAESAALILKAAEAAASLTERLLSFSGQGKLITSCVDVCQLVNDAAQLLRPALTESIELQTCLDPDLLPVEVDGRALEQAIINLAVNARDAIGNVGGWVKLSGANVTFTDEMVGGNPSLGVGRYVCISVSDNGPGMSEEVVSKAFEPFFTTKDVGKGTGLGLSTVYGFAKQSGGSVCISSELGHGTTVNLYLPASDACSPLETVSEIATDAVTGHGRSVLVVEDQTEVRNHVERLLTKSGFVVTTASDGPSALALLKAGNAFDVLFTDIIMPGGMNGVKLAEAAKGVMPQIKVLYTSGFPASAFDEMGIVDLNEIGLLRKPYKSTELIAAISKLWKSTAN